MKGIIPVSYTHLAHKASIFIRCHASTETASGRAC